MAKFEVLVFGSTFAEAVIEVDAVDADAAHEAAMERVATDKTIKWKREEPTACLSEIEGVTRGLTAPPAPSFDDDPYLTPEENLKVNQKKAELIALLDAYNSVELPKSVKGR